LTRGELIEEKFDEIVYRDMILEELRDEAKERRKKKEMKEGEEEAEEGTT